MKTGRNDPCPCGSGEKYKQCCMDKDGAPSETLQYRRLSEVYDHLIERLLRHAERVFGPTAVEEAMSEFLVWPEPDDPIDEAVVDRAEPLFWPWYVFNWEYEAEDGEVELPGPEGKTVAELYVETHGNRMNPIEKLLIDSINREPYSFWEVSDVEPGMGLTIEDLLRELSIKVYDPVGSKTFQPGDLLFGRAVVVAKMGRLVGISRTVIPSKYKPDVMGVKEWLTRGGKPITKDTLWDWDAEIREWFFDIEEALNTDPDTDLLDDDGAESLLWNIDETSPEWMEDPEVLDQLAEAVSAFWGNWLDREHDALDGLTPRQAAKTAKGRKAVAALLAEMEKEHDPDAMLNDVSRLGIRWARDILGLI